VPLGGNRAREPRVLANLLATFLLGGLWHGAAWTFVAWGAFHGVGLVAEHALGGRIRTPAWLRWAVTFHLVVFGWILFRSEDLAMAGTFLSRLVVPGEGTLWTPAIVVAIVVVIGLQLLPSRPVERFQFRLERVRPLALSVAFAMLVAVVGATVSSQGVAPFIYFRF
jgi:D-alanyl-lipoteichoic acid acyltransferase DltB (MBOAT superfamily)